MRETEDSFDIENIGVKSISDEMGFITGFLISLLLLSFLGDKVLLWVLILLLISMLLLNTQKIESLMRGFRI